MNLDQTILFIGGSKDGERMQFCDPPLEFISTKREIYKGSHFVGESERFKVYILDGMTGDQAMRALIDGFEHK